MKMSFRNRTAQISRGKAPVYLNVYDLASINGVTHWFGLGMYHSGVQVYDVEYGYGGHDESTTGIYKFKPKQFLGFTCRQSILIGWTDIKQEDMSKVMKEFAGKYRGNSYNVIANNCNHFSNDACIKLTGNPIPRWVNRLARTVGRWFCGCMIPADLNDLGKVRDVGAEEEKARQVSQKKNQNISKSSSSSIMITCRVATNNSR